MIVRITGLGIIVFLLLWFKYFNINYGLEQDVAKPFNYVTGCVTCDVSATGCELQSCKELRSCNEQCINSSIPARQ